MDRLRAALGTPGTARAMDRRGFFLSSGVALGVAAVTGGGGYLLQRRFDVSEARADLTLPTPASPAPPLPAGADLAETVDGLTPLVTRNGDFYRVDTAISVPQIRPSDYELELTGSFDSPARFSLEDLYGRGDLIERDITLTCVSNEVGGGLAGTARWIGVPLGAFLRENGIADDSTAAGLPLQRRHDDRRPDPRGPAGRGRDARIAMNGEPLPVEHGFPVRMIIPGLYGYVSACKWLVGIEATTFDAFDAYWVQRNWTQQGPIKVAARIDTPAPLRRFPSGRRAIAGVAWAQTRGIGSVEVRIDDGDWLAADLAPEVDADVWRQWVLPYDFSPAATSSPSAPRPPTARCRPPTAPRPSPPGPPACTPSRWSPAEPPSRVGAMTAPAAHPDRDRLLELIVELAVVHGKVTLSSGREADWYIDMRRLTLHHEGAPLVGRVMRQLTGDLRYDVVGGLTLGADPVATAMLHAASRGRGLPRRVRRPQGRQGARPAAADRGPGRRGPRRARRRGRLDHRRQPAHRRRGAAARPARR